MTGNREREKKKRGPRETEGKKRVSFVFRNQFLISLCFSPNRHSFFSPPSHFSRFSLLPSSAWVLRLGLWKRRHGIFPQFYRSRPNPTPTHFLSLPPLPPSHVRREYWGKPSTLHCVFSMFVAELVVLNSTLLWWHRKKTIAFNNGVCTNDHYIFM